jgi:hypothetical protein
MSTFQPILCMKLTQQVGSCTLAPRPKNSAKFLQALAQLHHEFQISKKPSPQTMLEQIAEQKKRFDVEISQQRHEIRENQAQISEKRARLKNILIQLEQEYVSIKIENQKILNRIDLEQNMDEIRILSDRITQKINNENYVPSRARDSLKSFDILYKKYNIKTGEENELKKTLEEDGMRADKDQQITVLRNGCVGHYNRLTNSIEILVIDLSNPKSQWHIEKQKRETIHQEMREIFATLQNIQKNTALIQSQAEERNKQIACLMLQEQQLLSQINIQSLQDHAAQEFDQVLSENLKQDFDQYISTVSDTQF